MSRSRVDTKVSEVLIAADPNLGRNNFAEMPPVPRWLTIAILCWIFILITLYGWYLWDPTTGAKKGKPGNVTVWTFGEINETWGVIDKRDEYNVVLNRNTREINHVLTKMPAPPQVQGPKRVRRFDACLDKGPGAADRPIKPIDPSLEKCNMQLFIHTNNCYLKQVKNIDLIVTFILFAFGDIKFDLH